MQSTNKRAIVLCALALGSVHAASAANGRNARPAMSLSARHGGARAVLLHAAAPAKVSAEREQPKTGKLWTPSTFTRDHVRFMTELFHYRAKANHEPRTSTSLPAPSPSDPILLIRV